MTFPGYVKPADMLIDAGVLYVGDVPVGMGASRGGLNFDPGITMRNVDFDGKASDIAGNDRVLRYMSKITGRMLGWSETHLGYYEPGATVANVAGPPAETTVTPISAQKFLDGTASTGDYLEDVDLIWRMQTGKIGHVTFGVALVEKYTVATQPDNEGEVDISIAARLPAAETDLTKCPYVHKISDAAA